MAEVVLEGFTVCLPRKELPYTLVSRYSWAELIRMEVLFCRLTDVEFTAPLHNSP
ncbi:hypothetical protein Hamer_G017594 [Homarus americanus]|uniref:Uncharacterized protein n=1 Tax=Homarus americanus TaxID=6706 RepID=A0A8J5MK42_HOMAM|nr:hypothetical protein Hamer_G017594 [Homarus americanus]